MTLNHKRALDCHLILPVSMMSILLACAVLVLVLGIALILYSTARGIGVSPDGVTYVLGARSILECHQYCGLGDKPITHWPPAYSLVLAALSVMGLGDPLLAARLLHAFLFSVTTLIAAAISYSLSNRRVGAVLLTAFLMLTSPANLVVHAMAQSEPLFLLFLLAGLYSLCRYLWSGGPRWFASTCALLAVATMTRYAGLVLIPFAAVCELMFVRKKLLPRLGHACLLVAGISLPVCFWAIRNCLVGGSATNRTLAFHPIGLSHLQDGLETVSSWLLPSSFRYSSVAGLVILALLWVLTRSDRPVIDIVTLDFPLLARRVFGLFSLCYVGFVCVSICFLDYHTPINGIILLPAFACLAVSVPCLAVDLSARLSSKHSGYIALATMGVLVLGLALCVRTGRNALRYHEDGLEFTSRAWQSSDTLHYIRSHPEQTLLYSNAPDALKLLADRNAFPLPVKFSPNSAQRNPAVCDRILRMKAQVQRHGGWIVFFRGIHRPYFVSEPDLRTAIELVAVAEMPDGAIYTVRRR